MVGAVEDAPPFALGTRCTFGEFEPPSVPPLLPPVGVRAMAGAPSAPPPLLPPVGVRAIMGDDEPVGVEGVTPSTAFWEGMRCIPGEPPTDLLACATFCDTDKGADLSTVEEVEEDAEAAAGAAAGVWVIF